MKTKNQISLDYQRVIDLTKKLDEIVNRIKKEFDANTDSLVAELSAGWKGENADEFIAKAKSIKEKTIPSAEKIGKLSEGVRSNAEAIYAADMEALRIAETRKS